MCSSDLGPQNGSESLGPEKLLKIVSCATIKETENAEQNNDGGLGGLGRWPPRSTWITIYEICCAFQCLYVVVNALLWAWSPCMRSL